MMEYTIERRDYHIHKYPRKMSPKLQAVRRPHRDRSSYVPQREEFIYKEEQQKLAQELNRLKIKDSEREKEKVLRNIRAEEFKKGEKAALAKAEREEEEEAKLKALIQGEIAAAAAALEKGKDGEEIPKIVAGEKGDGDSNGSGGEAHVGPLSVNVHHRHTYDHTYKIPIPPKIAKRIEMDGDYEDYLRGTRRLLEMERKAKGCRYFPLLGPGYANSPQTPPHHGPHFGPDASFIGRFPDFSREDVGIIWDRIHGSGRHGV